MVGTSALPLPRKKQGWGSFYSACHGGRGVNASTAHAAKVGRCLHTARLGWIGALGPQKAEGVSDIAVGVRPTWAGRRDWHYPTAFGSHASCTSSIRGTARPPHVHRPAPSRLEASAQPRRRHRRDGYVDVEVAVVDGTRRLLRGLVLHQRGVDCHRTPRRSAMSRRPPRSDELEHIEHRLTVLLQRRCQVQQDHTWQRAGPPGWRLACTKPSA